MNSSTRTRRVAALLGTIGALLVLGASAQAATSKPASMSKAEYRALMIRSQALNDKYGLGTSARPAAMTKAEYRALMIRSQAMNDMYGLGRSHVARQAEPAQPSVVSNDTFAWADFGIGAAAMLGLVLVSIGLIAGGRHGRRAPRTRISS
jgi:hypothetical protein